MILSQLNLGKKLFVSILGDDTGVFNSDYISQLIEVLSESEMLISTPMNRESTVDLAVGEQLKVSFSHDGGYYLFNAVIEENILEGVHNLYKIALAGEIHKVQRREFFRVSTNMPVLYTYNANGKEIHGQGITKDISGGGLKFVAGERFNSGDLIDIFIKLNQKFELRTKVSIVRTEYVDYNKYEVSCRFIAMDFNSREQLIKNIFEIQRNYIKKDKSL